MLGATFSLNSTFALAATGTSSVLGATFPLPTFALVANATPSMEILGGVSTLSKVKSSIAALGQGPWDDASWDKEA